jgi:ZIP family zinc transporter
MAESLSAIWLGSAASLLAGLGAGLGALPVLFFVRALPASANAFMLGSGAGVMLAASSFSLIAPGLEAAGARGHAAPASAAMVAAGILLGAVALAAAHRWLPHEHFVKGPEGAHPERLRRIWLFVLAITLHNFPEGLAVGVGFGGGDVSNGIPLTAGIALQNLPEGLAVALALLEVGYGRFAAFGLAFATGLVEPVGGVLGVTAVTLSHALLPWAMAFAAGAMLFVVSGEIIPESHRLGHDLSATVGVVIGFVLMTVLDAALG